MIIKWFYGYVCMCTERDKGRLEGGREEEKKITDIHSTYSCFPQPFIKHLFGRHSGHVVGTRGQKNSSIVREDRQERSN